MSETPGVNLPWTSKPNPLGSSDVIYDAGKQIRALTDEGLGEKIVLAVNNHDDLLFTLKGAADALSECAKQLRLTDNHGHANLAEAHVTAARALLTAIGGAE